jgi:UDP-N-acetylmuramate--alanine ligase
VFKNRDFKIYDDYAHNPGKIKACITALRQAWKTEKITVVYQPHRYSRLETMYDDTMAAFVGADLVLVLPVYSAGELASQDFSTDRLARDITSKSEVKALPLSQDFKEIPELVLKNSFKPGIIITVGAGNVSTVAQNIRSILDGNHGVDGRQKE